MAAITFVAAAGNDNALSTNLTVNKPTGTVQGDVMFALITFHSAISITAAPSGWSLLRTDTNTTDGSKAYVYWKAAGASEPGSYQWTHALTGFTATIATYRGAGTTAPVVVEGATVDNTGGSTSIVAPSLTTPVASALLIGFFTAFHTSGRTVAAPGSMTTRRASASNQYSHVVADEQLGAAGATGTRTATASAATTKDIGVVFALGPGNVAPNAPTLTSPIGGEAVNRAAALNLQGTFSDRDAGDQLSQTEVEYRPSGGSTTSLGTAAASGTTFSRTVAGGTFTAGSWEWRARTWDAAGEVGPWSSWAAFTAIDAPAAPVITAPTDGGTIGSDPFTVAWTAPSQEAFQVRTTDDEVPTTVHTDTGTVTDAASRSRSVAFPVQRTEFVQVRVRYAGLWSPWASNEATVAYTAPDEPSLMVTAHASGAFLTVTPDNPGGGEAAAGNDIERSQRRTLADAWSAAVRVAAAVPPDTAWDDCHVEHRMDYRYRVVASASSGASVTSDWVTAPGVTADLMGELLAETGDALLLEDA